MNRPSAPLILAYHAVDPRWMSPLAVTEEALASQASLLAARGYVGLTVTDAEEKRRNGTLPARSVVFTFDDGYQSTLSAAAVLARFGYPGTVFVTTRYVDDGTSFSWFGVHHEPREKLTPLAWDDLRGLVAQGWEVGSHTVNHPLLSSADDAQLAEELSTSKARVAEAVGRCDSLAYPYGEADARVAVAAHRAGYRTAVTLTGVVLADEPMRRPRVGLFTRDTGARLRMKLSAPALGARKTGAARLARRLRPARPWIPAGGAG